ncbi:MAG: helix-turn-helix domain-containing protein [Deltaproteobacteria bacterium]|nr:helix-turn-helix domain-containing protein [Deltaproteobacteria bacterium]
MFEGDLQSYYEILDVKPDAGQNEIRQAYFRAKSAYGKDSAALYSLFDEHETRLVIETIEQAYLVLSNPEKRKEYDKVHGFLKGGDLLPQIKKSNTSTNVFSFAKGVPEGGSDPAQQAAHAVFGSGSMSEMGGNESSAAGFAQPAPAAQSNAAMMAKGSRDEGHEDYSTPRTLAAAGAAGPPVQEYISGSFSSRENRLGIVRRIDLLKPYDRNPATEEEIVRESTFRGEFLRKVRVYKSISVEELSDFTKISKTYINCIESEEFESLPAPAYLRGFIIQIAKALKLPGDKAAAAYMSHYKSTVLK